MDQAVFAGVGNVYRAEVLFRHRIHPLRPGKTLRVGQFRAIWDDLVELMHEGVRTGPDRHRPPRAHAGGDGPPAAGRRPRRRGLRLPPDRAAVPRVRYHGADGRVCMGEIVLVSALSAHVPVASRTLEADHISDMPSQGRRLRDVRPRVPSPGAASPCACAGRCRSPTARPLFFLVLLTARCARSAASPSPTSSRRPCCCSRCSSAASGWARGRCRGSSSSSAPASACCSSTSRPISLRSDRAGGGHLRHRAADHGHLVPAEPPGRLRPAGRVDVHRPARPHLQAGQPAGPAAGVAGRVGGEVGGRHLVRRRLHRGQALLRTTSSSWSSSTSPARASRPGRAPCSSPARSTASSPRCRATSSCPAANDYLLGQDWGEGFATAIHLHLDLRHRRLRAAQGRSPAGGLAARRLGSLVGAQLRRARRSA